MEQRLLKNFDWLLFGLFVMVAVAGILAIASATQVRLDDPATWATAERQALYFLGGLAPMAVLISIDYHHFARWSRHLYVATIASLIAVLFFGTGPGVNSWFDLGPVQIQPAEFAKIAIIITLADWLAGREGVMNRWQDLILPILHVALPMLLIFMQPDLGTAVVFPAILLGMLYMAGVPGLRLAGGVAGGVGLVVAIFFAHLHWGLPLPLEDYQLNRLLVFLNPSKAPMDAGYHIIQSQIAIGSGQIWGQGLAGGIENQLSYLPEQQTDFIFSVVGAELGYVGTVALLLLLFFLLARGLVAASVARDLYGSLLVVGVVSMLACHVLINVGMVTGIMPVTGLPLPFISYGGSSLLTNMMAVAVMLNVSMRRQKILF